MGYHGIVCMATYYRPDGLGIKSKWGQDFQHLSRLALGHTQPHVVSYLQGKTARCGIDHPPPSSTEVNKRVVLYLYQVSEPLWPVKGGTLPLSFVMLLCYILYFNSKVSAYDSNLQNMLLKFEHLITEQSI